MRNKLVKSTAMLACAASVFVSGTVLAQATTGLKITRMGSDTRTEGVVNTRSGTPVIHSSARADAVAPDGSVSQPADGIFVFQTDKVVATADCDRNNAFYLDPNNAADRALIATVITAQVDGQTVAIETAGACTAVFNGWSIDKAVLIFADTNQ